MNKVIKKEIEFAGRKLSLQAGLFAPQTNMSVYARYGDTAVLVTVVANEVPDDQEFFPLRVDYQEKLYAGGFIKTSRFIKREGRPSEEATIAARLIDHAIRPLFPKDFMDAVQVVATVLSVDQENDPEVLSMIATSAALHASNIPWNGPMATSRIGIDENETFILNPSFEDAERSPLNLVVSTLKNDKILAMEAGAKIVPEEKILNALKFAIEENKRLLHFIDEFANEVGNKKYKYEPRNVPKDFLKELKEKYFDEIKSYVETPMEKMDAAKIKRGLLGKVLEEYGSNYSKAFLSRALDSLEKEATQNLILKDKKRPDGRGLDEIRDMTIKVGVLPRTHGSGFFSRGLTQTLTITTLGSISLEQIIQSMYGEETKRYMHHYYGPGYSIGEVKPLGSPGRREIGHGALAEKALLPVIPSKEEFPYTIRVVSEILSQNGSSSMAATCGSTLSLMDAGVPIKAPVAGIAIGLITDKLEKEFVILTDIAGVEDMNGFMDFKTTGTRDGVTAIQMDIKLKGIPITLFDEILHKSKKARLKILDAMEKVISKPKEISKLAPKVDQLEVKPEDVGLIIGAGGRVIKDIIAKTNANIDISEPKDGKVIVNITGDKLESVKEAKSKLLDIIKEVKVGEIYEGKVKRVADFGAIVEIAPNKEGLLHVSELSHEYVSDPHRVIKVGDRVRVKVIGVESDGKISLSKKALEPATERRNTRKGPKNKYRTPYYKRPGYWPNSPTSYKH